MERLVDAIAEAFRSRGADDLTAAVVAETAVGVVKVALRHWVASDGQEPLLTVMTDSLNRISSAFGVEAARIIHVDPAVVAPT